MFANALFIPPKQLEPLKNPVNFVDSHDSHSLYPGNHLPGRGRQFLQASDQLLRRFTAGLQGLPRKREFLYNFERSLGFRNYLQFIRVCHGRGFVGVFVETNKTELRKTQKLQEKPHNFKRKNL